MCVQSEMRVNILEVNKYAEQAFVVNKWRRIGVQVV